MYNFTIVMVGFLAGFLTFFALNGIASEIKRYRQRDQRTELFGATNDILQKRSAAVRGLEHLSAVNDATEEL